MSVSHYKYQQINDTAVSLQSSTIHPVAFNSFLCIEVDSEKNNNQDTFSVAEGEIILAEPCNTTRWKALQLIFYDTVDKIFF